LLLKDFTDSVVHELSTAMHQPVVLHKERWQDVLFRPFTSNKKIIQRSHADYGFVVTVTLDFLGQTDLFGTKLIEPSITISLKMKNAAGATVWQNQGFASGTSAPAKVNFACSIPPFGWKGA